MTWLAASDDSTGEQRIPDTEGAPTFTLGFWPPRYENRFSSRVAAAMKTEADMTDESLDKSYALSCDMARYCVRGWTGIVGPDGKEISPKFREEKIDGEKFKVLDDASLKVLSRARLLGAVAKKSYFFNILSEEEKKTFGLRWPSRTSTSGTVAATATPSGEVKQEPSSGSTDASSTDAPSS